MNSNKLFSIFVGSYIHVITKSLKGTQHFNGGKAVGPIIIDGFLLDEDDMFYYLGETPEEVTDAILKEEVVRVYLPLEDMMKQAFGDIKIPSTDEMS